MYRLSLALAALGAATGARAQPLLHELVPPPAPLVTARLGTAVAGIDDLDGDGRGDLLVGATRAGVSPALTGRVGVYSGADGALLYVLSAPDGDQFGEAVAAVPDTDGDSVADVLVGSPREDASGGPLSAGRAHLFSGATGALLHTLASPNEGYQASFGTAIAGVPDADGDGRGDLLVGSYESASGTPFTGRAYLFSGATGTLLRTLTSPDLQARGNFGTAVAGVPDLDGDGRGDLLVGAHGEDDGADGAGRAYLLSGATGAVLRTLRSGAPDLAGDFGADVAAVPDVDGDGRADLLVGARYEDDEFPLLNVGRAYLFSGATGARLRTFAAPSPQRDGFFGWAVAGVPDVDGDGRGDVLVGAHTTYPEGAPFRAGRAFLFSGASGALLATLVSPNEQGVGLFGVAVAGVPDADGDGMTDLVVGANFEDRGGLLDGGNAYLFSGAWATSTASDGRDPAADPRLGPAAPNPFAVSTRLPFDLTAAGPVRLAVYDALGRSVAVLVDGPRAAGAHEVPFEAGRLSAGVYVVRLEAGGRLATRTVLLVR